MSILQSKKLQEEQAEKRSTQFEMAGLTDSGEFGTESTLKPTAVSEIKRVTTYNDYVAVLQGVVASETGIEIGDAALQHEGYVVGVPNGEWGDNLPKVGDKVKFYDRMVSERISPKNGYYAGRHLIIIKVTGILFKLPAETPAIVD